MPDEAGDFAEFVGARERALQRTAWLLTGEWALAEDLVQTALARTWLRWDRIRRRDSPDIYVRQVIVNTWLTWRRRKWRGELRPYLRVSRDGATVTVVAIGRSGAVAGAERAHLIAEQISLATGRATRMLFRILSFGPKPGAGNGWLDNGRLVPLAPLNGADTGPEMW